MKIEHIALWTKDLEQLREFYTRHFGAHANVRYTNATTGFSSYFLTFTSGARLEIMARADVKPSSPSTPVTGYAHLALALGSEEAVRKLTERLRADGVEVVSEPRRTGDGYYESVIRDPDGNLIELTV